MYLQQDRLMPEVQLDQYLFHDILALLKELIVTPSFSGEESFTATLIQCFLQNRGVETNRKLHNIWAFNRYYDPAKPTILLNSHHDTVKPNLRYTSDPFHPIMAGDKLYGLGSNNSGGCLVSMLAAFLHFYQRNDLPYNLCYAATAEEETSGENGLKLILPDLGRLDFAIVGKPTLMNLAIAEKGLMVLDCVAKGTTGHAPGEAEDNAIYKVISDLHWFSSFVFPKVSGTLGAVKMNVSLVNTEGLQNDKPATCSFTVDVLMTDAYTRDEILQIVRRHVKGTVTPREIYLRPSVIDTDHPIVRAGMMMGCNTCVSPAISDQAFLNVPSVKLGPGDPARSNTPDEYIRITEIEEGINVYTKILETLVHTVINRIIIDPIKPGVVSLH